MSDATRGLGDEDGELLRMFREHAGGDLHKWHHYFGIYERYFARFRAKPISILEIGVSAGGSLRLWRKYFGESAAITGIDVNPACARHKAEGISIYIGDQADAAFLARVADERGPFDIVIDDGGHTTRQQIVSLQALLPRVKEAGVYLVEDLHTNLWSRFNDHPLGISFFDVARGMAEKLTSWHADPRTFERYALPPERRQGGVTVPEIARSVYSIAFYDSVVVFEKRRIGEPRRELR